MNTWLDHWDRRYTDRVRLLVEILPVLAQEPRFALKGGTAINLFEHDLPRLSVDIDWLGCRCMTMPRMRSGSPKRLDDWPICCAPGPCNYMCSCRQARA